MNTLFSAYKKYYTGSNRLNMGLNRINMCLFTLSLTELLIGIAAQGRRALWDWHQSHMTRAAVICVCGKTPSTKHCLYYQQISLLELSSEAGRKYWKEFEPGFVECWSSFWIYFFMFWFLSDAIISFSGKIRCHPSSRTVFESHKNTIYGQCACVFFLHKHIH